MMVIVLYYVIVVLQASSEYTDEKVDLEVYLINGKKVTLKVEAFDRTDQVLEVRANRSTIVTDYKCLYPPHPL